MREYPVKKSKKIDGINVKPHVLMFFQSRNDRFVPFHPQSTYRDKRLQAIHAAVCNLLFSAEPMSNCELYILKYIYGSCKKFCKPGSGDQEKKDKGVPAERRRSSVGTWGSKKVSIDDPAEAGALQNTFFFKSCGGKGYLLYG